MIRFLTVMYCKQNSEAFILIYKKQIELLIFLALSEAIFFV